MAGEFPAFKARKVLEYLHKAGFVEVRRTGSHRMLRHEDGRVIVFAFHDSEEIGPRMLARIARRAGLSADDFR